VGVWLERQDATRPCDRLERLEHVPQAQADDHHDVSLGSRRQASHALLRLGLGTAAVELQVPVWRTHPPDAVGVTRYAPLLGAHVETGTSGQDSRVQGKPVARGHAVPMASAVPTRGRVNEPGDHLAERSGMVTLSASDRARFFTDVAEAMHTLAHRSSDTAGAYRLHDMVTAHASLASVTEELRRFSDMVSALADLGVDRPALADAGLDVDARVEGFGRGLETALDAYAREDWLQLADALEWDIASELRSWAAALRHLAQLHEALATA
jgi:hypothetical protein